MWIEVIILTDEQLNLCITTIFYEMYLRSEGSQSFIDYPGTLSESKFNPQDPDDLVRTQVNGVANPSSTGHAPAVAANIRSKTSPLGRTPVWGSGTYLNYVKRAFLSVPEPEDVQTGAKGAKNGIKDLFGLHNRPRAVPVAGPLSIPYRAPISLVPGALILSSASSSLASGQAVSSQVPSSATSEGSPQCSLLSC